MTRTGGAQAIFETPIGPLYAEASARGVQYLSFQREAPGQLPDIAAPAEGEEAAAALLEEARRQIDEYFEGRRRDFALALDLRGTPFRLRAWQAIAAIPFGRTATYSDIAAAAGNPNAYRAAGSACGANPVPIIIPCHRVIGTDRGLHGFGGGLDTKVWLLRHEGSLDFAAPVSRRVAQPSLV